MSVESGGGGAAQNAAAQPLNLHLPLPTTPGAPVTLDAAALDRVKKESPAPAAFKGEDEATAAAADAAAAPGAGVPLLTAPQARAVVLARALSVANGNSRVR